jgi:hypothetical protein
MNLEEAVNQWKADQALYHTVIHGDAATTVATESGAVPSVAKAIADLSATITAAFSSGFVARAANAAARNTLGPTQIGQLLIQLDTHDLYYATGVTVGAWALHPVQSALAAATAASASAAAVQASLNAKVDRQDIIGGAWTAAVFTTQNVEAARTFAQNYPDAHTHELAVVNGNFGMTPRLSNRRCTGLVNGIANRTQLFNTSRGMTTIGSLGAFFGNPKVMRLWGFQTHIGVLGIGNTSWNNGAPRAEQMLAAYQSDRQVPNFQPSGILTTAGQVEFATFQDTVTMVRTADGYVLTAGEGTGAGRVLIGAGVSKNQATFCPLYFPYGGSNRPIRMFDAHNMRNQSVNAAAIFVDDQEGVWITTTNPLGSTYGAGITGRQDIPKRLNEFYPGWNGKVVRKVRVDCSTGIYILFTDGSLWAGGGSNSTGLLGTGNTANIGTLIQVASGVSDFDISGSNYGSMNLFILQGTTLKGAGYNYHGQLGSGSSTSSSTFLTIAADVNLIRLGGNEYTLLFYRKANGDWFATGRNYNGSFGNGGRTDINVNPIAISQLRTLCENFGFADLVIATSNNGSFLDASCLLCQNGTAYVCGTNYEYLGTGVTTDYLLSWTQVVYAPLDKWEKLVEVAPTCSPSNGPSFIYRTNYGRLLMAGVTSYSFHGVAQNSDNNYPTLRELTV